MAEESISPLAKRLAEENNVEWRRLTGSGEGGKVVERDVLDYLSRVMAGEEDVNPTPEPLPEGMSSWGADAAGVGSYFDDSGSVGAAGSEPEFDEGIFLFDDDPEPEFADDDPVYVPEEPQVARPSFEGERPPMVDFDFGAPQEESPQAAGAPFEAQPLDVAPPADAGRGAEEDVFGDLSLGGEDDDVFDFGDQPAPLSAEAPADPGMAGVPREFGSSGEREVADVVFPDEQEGDHEQVFDFGDDFGAGADSTAAHAEESDIGDSWLPEVPAFEGSADEEEGPEFDFGGATSFESDEAAAGWPGAEESAPAADSAEPVESVYHSDSADDWTFGEADEPVVQAGEGEAAWESDYVTAPDRSEDTWEPAGPAADADMEEHREPLEDPAPAAAADTWSSAGPVAPETSEPAIPEAEAPADAAPALEVPAGPGFDEQPDTEVDEPIAGPVDAPAAAFGPMTSDEDIEEILDSPADLEAAGVRFEEEQESVAAFTPPRPAVQEEPAVAAGPAGERTLVADRSILRREIALGRLARVRASIAAELGAAEETVMAALLMRAAARAAAATGFTAGPLALASLEGDSVRLKGAGDEPHLSFRDLVAHCGQDAGGAHDGQQDAALVVADLSALGVDDAYLQLGAPLLTLGRPLKRGRTGREHAFLALSGEFPVAGGAHLLAAVAEYLQDPVRLLL